MSHSETRVSNRHPKGFTLIELAIVLVIIGLIVGGILVGQNLIQTSEARATISQIEKYNTATNTFRVKYSALPGDMNGATAVNFGFSTRGTSPGQGDGNGVVEGSAGGLANGFLQGGETLSFWSDLSIGCVTASGCTAPLNINMVDGSFTLAVPSASAPTIAASNLANYYPAAKLGRGNYIYVFSSSGVNYFGLADITSTTTGVIAASASVSVQQANYIDLKMDDGFPASGNVKATWANGTLAENATPPVVNAVSSDTSTSCYNSTTTAGAYSLAINNGGGVNCALSFRFQ
jgi:prepilin-type N-terminal cleavage/methylation domain-containing protein